MNEAVIDSIEGEMTPEQVAELLGFGEGDTDESEKGDAPEVTTDQEVVEQEVDKGSADAKADDDAADQSVDPLVNNDVKPVISARDGIHTIPYEKLEEARQGEKHWKAQAEASQRELAELRAQADARKAAGEAPTETDKQSELAQSAIDQGVDPDLFGDFSEEALAKGVTALANKLVEERMAAIEQRLAPIQQQQEQDATAAHYQAIHAAHPDAASIAESSQLADWINAQPSFVRDGYKSVLEQGTTNQIIELFDSFKQSTGVATPAKQGVSAAAKAAIDALGEQVPASLTDVPGGRAAASSREEAMAGMDGVDLMLAMDDMTPEQVERYLNNL